MKLAAHWFSGYKLGEFVEISLSVTDLATSLSFYERLGLKKVGGGDLPYPWAIVSDGSLHLGLHQSVFPSPTLSYFSVLRRDPLRTGTSLRINILREFGITMGQAQQLGVRFGFGENGQAIAVDFNTPEGQRVFLADMLMHQESVTDRFSIPIRDFLSTCETFGELSLKTEDVEAAAAYWEQLGFQRLAGNNTPYPWALLSDGLIRLGLYQAVRFTRPAISYFRSNMQERLEQLEQQGLQFVSTRKDAQGRSIGALIHSPDGQPILLFTGEIKT
jgi:catechol 2,3-dioxygenase-like lactoylglutathione lyase family enzyme